MEELLGDEYYVELFAEIAESEPITEAIDEVPAHLNVAMLVHCVAPSVVDLAACDPTVSENCGCGESKVDLSVHCRATSTSTEV